MRQPRLIFALFALWAAIYGYSFWALAMTEPTGDGFTRGLNRVSAFLTGQAVAGALGFGIWVLGRDPGNPPTRRWMLRIPPLLTITLVLMIAGLIAYAWIADPASRATPPSTSIGS